MKYLIQNRKEFTITIVALIVAILDILKVLGLDVPNVSEEYLLTIISAIMGVLVWFYNMPTSNENNEITPIMRKAKRMAKNSDMTLLDAIQHVAEGSGEDD